MTRIYFLYGEFVDANRARVKFCDIQGLLRGHAVFETVRTYNRRPFALEEHLRRLKGSAERLGLKISIAQEDIARIVHQGVKLLGDEALIRLFLVAGDSGPFLLLTFDPLLRISPETYEKGVKLKPVDFPRPFPEVKGTCRLAGWLARREDGEAWEVLYCPNGEITEAETSNFFLVLASGTVVTAPADRVLPGVTRGIVTEILKRMGIPLEERCPRLEELRAAKEAFITGSVKEILPVVRVGELVIGNGAPGELTRRLHLEYRAEVQRRMEG